MQLHEETLFHDALEIQDPQARADYLSHACNGNNDLRRRIERLLLMFSKGEVLEPTEGVEQRPSLPLPSREQTGESIGPYKLLEKLGEGGMGIVYMAEQLQPIRRKVALKIIKAGMDTGQVVARFEAERQALAIMNHPNIAKVLDAGATDLGRPYFVMELVRGIPITEYCNQHRLNLRDRLQLFVTVCEAVHHAHQKGIIHRDIKPSNLLVELHDVKAVPKVIDFGIAKATNQQLTDRTLFTNFAQVIGTPMYMSPEQARQSGFDIDIRSDIYSLGVLLYELLTGTTPFTKETLSKVGYDEWRRIIQEEEPARPSARISTLRAEELSTLATNQRSDVFKVKHHLRGELDWIVAKALDKDRTRRYQSALEFGDDINRFVNGEPIEAHPPSLIYQLKKIAHRHLAILATAALILIVLLGATGISIYFAFNSGRALKAVRSQEFETEKQRDLAKKNLEIALKAVDSFATKVAENQLLDVPAMQPLRRELLQSALDYYLRFSEDQNNQSLQNQLASAYFRIGKITEQLGKISEALSPHLKALDIRIAITESAEKELQHQLELAESQIEVGSIYEKLGKTSDSRKFRQDAIDLLRLATISNDQESIQMRTLLAKAYSGMGSIAKNSEEAIRFFEEGVEIAKKLCSEFPSTENQIAFIQYTGRLANRLHQIGRKEDEIELIRHNIDLLVTLTSQYPGLTSGWRTLAGNYHNLGSAMIFDRPDEAANYITKSIEIKDRLSKENPLVLEYKFTLAQGFINLAIVEKQNDRKIERSLSAVRLLEDLVNLDSQRIEYQSDLGLVLRNVYGYMIKSGKAAEAKPYLQRALDVFRHIAEVKDDKFPIMLARTICSLADLEMRLGNHAHAKKLLDETRQILSKNFEADSHNTQVASAHASMCISIARLQEDMGERTDSIANYRSALDDIKLNAAKSDDIKSTSVFMSWLGCAILRSGDANEAEAILKQSREIIESIPEDERIEECWIALGTTLYYANEWQKAKKAFEKGFARSPDSVPNTAKEAWWYFAMTLSKLGEQERSTKIFEKLVAELNADYNGHDFCGFRSEAQAVLESAATSVPVR